MSCVKLEQKLFRIVLIKMTRNYYGSASVYIAFGKVILHLRVKKCFHSGAVAGSVVRSNNAMFVHVVTGRQSVIFYSSNNFN